MDTGFHPSREELLRYSNETLPVEQESSLRAHLVVCSECTRFQESYISFLDDLLAPLEKDEHHKRGTAKPEVQVLRRLLLQSSFREKYGCFDFLKLGSDALEELSHEFVRPKLQEQPFQQRASSRNLQVSVLALTGFEERYEAARLAFCPSWPSQNLELALQFSQNCIDWLILLLYQMEDAMGRPFFLILFEGQVDPEGLVEVHEAWEGWRPEQFELDRLKIIALSPKA